MRAILWGVSRAVGTVVQSKHPGDCFVRTTLLRLLWFERLAVVSAPPPLVSCFAPAAYCSGGDGQRNRQTSSRFPSPPPRPRALSYGFKSGASPCSRGWWASKTPRCPRLGRYRCLSATPPATPRATRSCFPASLSEMSFWWGFVCRQLRHR